MAFLRKILILFSKSKVYNLLHAQELTKSPPRTTDVCWEQYILKTIFVFLVRFPVILIFDQGAHSRCTWNYGRFHEKIEDFSFKVYCSQNTLTLPKLIYFSVKLGVTLTQTPSYTHSDLRPMRNAHVSIVAGYIWMCPRNAGS